MCLLYKDVAYSSLFVLYSFQRRSVTLTYALQQSFSAEQGR